MEEIEVLRAKAIASMVSSPSNPSVKRKSPDSKEEGELSPEMPTCSNALFNSTMLEENTMIEAADDPTKSKPDCLTGPMPDTIPSKLSCATNTQIQSSASRTYSRHFNTMQVPFKSNNNQSNLWQRKASDDNLVISFSDDDSTSSSSDKSNVEVLMNKKDIEESKPEKTCNNKDIVVKASTVPAPVPSKVLQGKIITKPVPKKGSVYTAKHLASSAEKYNPNPRYNTKTKATTIHNLRHQISAQGNGSKFHGRQSISQTNEIKTGDARGPASILDVGLAPREQMSKRLKHNVGISSRNISENNEKWQHADIAVTQSSSENLPPVNVNTCSIPEVSFKHRNNMDVDYPVINYKGPHLKQSGPNIEDESHIVDHVSPGNVSPHRSAANMTALHPRNSAKPGPVNSFHSLPSTMPGQHNNMNTQLSVSASGAPILERISGYNETALHPMNSAKPGPVNYFHSLPSTMPGQYNNMNTQLSVSTSGIPILERLSGYNENTDTLNFTSEVNIPREASTRFQTLIEMEDLLDKELAHAQELRRRCEVEERRALKVYREAQRALIEANEKCNLLYSKRELFSAEHRVLLMQSHGRTASGTELDIPENRCRMLDVHDFTPSRFSEQNDENCPVNHNRSIESRLAWEGNQSKETAAMCAEKEGISHDENLQDYKLLEASLRSKLVKRLGSRIVSKCDNAGEAEHLVKEGVPDEDAVVIKSPCLPDQPMNDVVKTDALYTEGVVSEERSRIANRQIKHSSSHNNGVSLTNEFHGIENSQDNSWSLEESCLPILKIGSALPSSNLHIVSKHAKATLYSSSNELSTTIDNRTLLHVETTKCVSDEENMTLFWKEFTLFGKLELHNYDLTIDPFWPFCMFDLRGKCNNEVCKWQHLRSVKSCSDSNGSNLLNAGKSDDIYKSQILPIPTYNIGWNLIEGDLCTIPPLLSRSNWQFWQRELCYSFSFPSNVQKSLYPYANNRDWNRPYSYNQIHSSFVKQLDHGSPDYENKLEIALDLFYGSSCKPDRKKALEVLSRAIETDPTSVVLWIVYLHIYYGTEKYVGKDDMFFHAVQHNKESYELWLLYINSRIQVDDQLNAYEMGLTTLCRDKNNKDAQYISTCILDIFLQMFDFLCMSGNVEKAVQKIYGLLRCPSDPLLSDVLSCLTISDKCLFWLCCIYLTIYRKLPEIVAQQFEYGKELLFGVEWPCIQLTLHRKEQSLNLMRLAVDKMIVDVNNDPGTKDEASIRSLHNMAICHIRCLAALEGLNSSSNLLAKYLKMYPTSIELLLISARLNDNTTQDVDRKGFEEALAHGPDETCNNHCLWNQYVEHALANNKIDLAEILITRWYGIFCNDTNQHDWNVEKDVFALLNLSLYKTLQKDTREANDAIIKALKLASPQDYLHCVKEHAAFTLANDLDWKRDNKTWCIILSLLNFYLGDNRATTILEPLSREYFKCIKKPRVRQLINRLLGPVSRGFTLVNSVLEVCFGTSLLPENIEDLKGFVDFIESLMEIVPTNYKLALFVCRLASKFPVPMKFWACSILCNSILQAVPVPPEHVWLEAANVTKELENAGISLKFLKQALVVHPFSVKLWQSCLDVCKVKDEVELVLENAKERGIELTRPSI